MKEYIECITKHRAKHFVCEFCNEHCSDEPCEPSDCEWMQFIESEPAADGVERKRGEWIKRPDERICPFCNDRHSYFGGAEKKFCSECGADMRGD